MTRNQLIQRLVMKQGKPAEKIAPPINAQRRGMNYVQMEDDSSNSYDDFFEFESDLADDVELPPSRDILLDKPNVLVEDGVAAQGIGFLEMEENISATSIIVMEELPEEVFEEEAIPSIINNLIKVENDLVENDLVENDLVENDLVENDFITEEEMDEIINDPIIEPASGRFKFIQCSYIKDNGDRCKRQAPSGATICSPHKRIMKKNSI